MTKQAWREGRLSGNALQAFEEWLAENPSFFEENCDQQTAALGVAVREALPREIEPPYADFFNERIMRRLGDEQKQPQPMLVEQKSAWRERLSWMLVPSAVAATVAFFVGAAMQSNDAPEQGQFAQTPVYVVQDGVVAEVSHESEAVEIVIQGLEPLKENLRGTHDISLVSSVGSAAVFCSEKSQPRKAESSEVGYF